MVNPNEDTEFNDALRAHGILPPKPPSRSPSPDIPHLTHADITQTIAATADAQQLSLLLEDEQLDSEDEAVFEDYRRRRLEEMRKEGKRGRFGTMEPLAREDFVRQVTEGSKEVQPGEEVDPQDQGDEEEGQKGGRRLRGTGVVVFLYKDSVPLSQHLRPLLVRLSAAHPSTKFLSIPASLCIPNYPDKNVPTLLVYRNGEITGNVVAGLGLRGMKTTVRDLETLLLRLQALEKPSPALRDTRRGSDDSDEDLDLNGGVGSVNTRSGGVRTGGGVGTGRGKGDESDGSDFDL
ncbi:hypothetical protein JCM24511_03676 [Saitozyma sp. JCM 24511]|nr:hypothetical protein JCM24511_03676 [Saitozyma sp. JCM 24511]